jgi:hypothetical protein
VCESDPQKDHENDEEYHIHDQGKVHQHCVGFHLISFVTVSSPGGADLAARGLSFARRSLSVKRWDQRKNRRRRLQPAFAYQPHLYDLGEHYVAKQREEKQWPIKRWQRREA